MEFLRKVNQSGEAFLKDLELYEEICGTVSEGSWGSSDNSDLEVD